MMRCTAAGSPSSAASSHEARSFSSAPSRRRRRSRSVRWRSRSSSPARRCPSRRNRSNPPSARTDIPVLLKRWFPSVTLPSMKDLGESRVLIVDDSKSNVDILVEALRGEYKLGVALNGESALASIARNPPDLVLLDIVMPGIDGYEVCRRLRAAPETREIPIMFLSSLEDVDKKTLGFEVGANDYVTKPFELLEVKARVRSLLKAKAYSDAIKEKIASEMRIAREIQLGMLPSNLSASAAGTGVELEAFLEPALGVGGDLYEVLRTDDGRLVVVIGDVSGKGVPAALFMAMTVTLV